MCFTVRETSPSDYAIIIVIGLDQCMQIALIFWLDVAFKMKNVRDHFNLIPTKMKQLFLPLNYKGFKSRRVVGKINIPVTT